MKKLIFISLFVFFSVSSFSQDYFTSKYWNRLTADTIKVNEWIIYKGDTIWFPTYTNGRGLIIKNVADPVDLTDVVNLQTLLDNATGFDSIDYNLSDNGFLRFLSSSIVIDSVLLDGRHVLLSDSTVVFVTPTQLVDSLDNYVTTEALVDSLTEYVEYSDSTDVYYTQHSIDSLLLIAGQKSVYEITLPINGTLSGSVAAAVEGVDYPTGWVLSASGGDLQVQHDLGRYSANSTVFYNTAGSSYRQLRNFDNAYSGVLNVDNNNVTIESISTFYTAYKLNIYILFE